MRHRKVMDRSLKEKRRAATARVKAYRSNMDTEKRIAIRKKDAERKRSKRSKTILTEVEKTEIREGNNLRKRRQRERENIMKRQLAEQNGSSSSSSRKDDQVVNKNTYQKL